MFIVWMKHIEQYLCVFIDNKQNLACFFFFSNKYFLISYITAAVCQSIFTTFTDLPFEMQAMASLYEAQEVSQWHEMYRQGQPCRQSPPWSPAVTNNLRLYPAHSEWSFRSQWDNMQSSLCNVVPRVRRHLSRQYRTEGRDVCCRCRLPNIFTALKMQWKKSWTRPFPHESLSQNIVKWAFVFSNKQIRGCFGERRRYFQHYTHPWPWYSHITREKQKA